MDLSTLRGSRWRGSCELWLDPLGNDAQRSECTLSIEDQAVHYTWQFEGKPQHGSIRLAQGGADFTDTWHQPQPMHCASVADARGLFQVQGSYGPDGDWGWRIAATLRTPSGELVLQMTNIAPWGEEGRAVRMIAARQA